MHSVIEVVREREIERDEGGEREREREWRDIVTERWGKGEEKKVRENRGGCRYL